jgi:acyl-CoA-binding protein
MNKNSEQFLKADEELLELYGLYKQTTKGNFNIEKPFFIKIKAWNSKL